MTDKQRKVAGRVITALLNMGAFQRNDNTLILRMENQFALIVRYPLDEPDEPRWEIFVTHPMANAARRPLFLGSGTTGFQCGTRNEQEILRQILGRIFDYSFSYGQRTRAKAEAALIERLVTEFRELQ